ncbi:Zinc transporter 7 [Cardamine amara subsp. amara]|uniref:Zinc transporter 7 n=1 Tax=Cardamine amara subsp. amara TaxID=228776 RepID=A0ABD1AB02_CARAN
MASSKACYKLITDILLLLSLTLTSLAGNAENADVSECKSESGDSSCHNNKEAQKLKIIAIPSILAASMIGVSLPLFSRFVPALKPDQDMFVIVKALASGVILATGFMHVLPDSFDDLKSKCLSEIWRKYPFTTLIAMCSALIILMIDSFAMSAAKMRNSKRNGEVKTLDNDNLIWRNKMRSTRMRQVNLVGIESLLRCWN